MLRIKPQAKRVCNVVVVAIIRNSAEQLALSDDHLFGFRAVAGASAAAKPLACGGGVDGAARYFKFSTRLIDDFREGGKRKTSVGAFAMPERRLAHDNVKALSGQCRAKLPSHGRRGLERPMLAAGEAQRAILRHFANRALGPTRAGARVEGEDFHALTADNISVGSTRYSIGIPEFFANSMPRPIPAEMPKSI